MKEIMRLKGLTVIQEQVAKYITDLKQGALLASCSCNFVCAACRWSCLNSVVYLCWCVHCFLVVCCIYNSLYVGVRICSVVCIVQHFEQKQNIFYWPAGAS